MTRSTRAHVVLGRDAAARRAAIARIVAAHPVRWAVLLGAGFAQFDTNANADSDRDVTVRTAPAGCACCIGLVAFRVALVALLREVRPERIAIELAQDEHSERVLATLADPGFDLSIEAIERV